MDASNDRAAIAERIEKVRDELLRLRDAIEALPYDGVTFPTDCCADTLVKVALDALLTARVYVCRQDATPVAAAAGSEQIRTAEATNRRVRENHDETIDELRFIITAVATQIRVAHEKASDDLPLSALAHYEEALGMLADHAGEWSPECGKLRDFTTLGAMARENAELREQVARAALPVRLYRVSDGRRVLYVLADSWEAASSAHAASSLRIGGGDPPIELLAGPESLIVARGEATP